MRLRFASLGGGADRACTHVLKWSKKLGLRLPAIGERINALIIVSDGAPDDIVALLMGYHFDGEHAVYLVKPKHTRYGAIEVLRDYVRNANSVTFMIDQKANLKMT